MVLSCFSLEAQFLDILNLSFPSITLKDMEKLKTGNIKIQENKLINIKIAYQKKFFSKSSGVKNYICKFCFSLFPDSRAF